MMSEKGIMRTRNHSSLIVYSPNHCCFQKNVQTFVLKIWKDKDIFRYIEFLVLNLVEIPVEIQDMEIFQDMKIFKDLDFPGFGSSTSHTVYRKTYSIYDYINYILTHLSTRC